MLLNSVSIRNHWALIFPNDSICYMSKMTIYTITLHPEIKAINRNSKNKSLVKKSWLKKKKHPFCFSLKATG